MRKYTNQQLSSAEIIAELVELAREVAAEADRGKTFDPPLTSWTRAFWPRLRGSWCRSCAAIKLVMEQMESMAPRYAEERNGA